VLDDGRVHRIRVEVKDCEGNSAMLRFEVQYRPPPEERAGPKPGTGSKEGTRLKVGAGPKAAAPPKIPPGGKMFYPGMVDGLETPDCAFFLSENSLYDSAVLGTTVAGYPSDPLSLPGGVSPVFAIGAPWVPLLQPMMVRLRLPAAASGSQDNGRLPPVNASRDSGRLPPSTEKIVMVRINGAEREVLRPEWQGAWASAKFYQFGLFQLVEDTQPPVIIPLTPLDGAAPVRGDRIAFSVKDDLGAVRNFRAELDGAWLCFSNDKEAAYIYKFDAHCPLGRHILKVSVEDVAGNRTVKEYHFIR
jgi:hypothetical protein